MAEKRDYYEVLGVKKGASDDEIKRAYEKMSGIASPKWDGMPRVHNPQAGEERILNGIEEIDLLKTLTMVLLHDIVEIDAGDTYAYDAAGQATAHEREQKAAERLYGLLPQDQGEKLRGLWEEFEARETPEAKFARTLDNFQPMMLNAAAQGKSWVEHGVHLSQVLRRNERTAEGSQVLWDHMREHYLAPNVEQGRLVDDTDGTWREGRSFPPTEKP